jgi:hypothetical protein
MQEIGQILFFYASEKLGGFGKRPAEEGFFNPWRDTTKVLSADLTWYTRSDLARTKNSSIPRMKSRKAGRIGTPNLTPDSGGWINVESNAEIEPATAKTRNLLLRKPNLMSSQNPTPLKIIRRRRMQIKLSRPRSQT